MNVELLLVGCGILIFVLISITYHTLKTNIELRFKLKSAQVKFGKYTEQFMALVDTYPYNPENFRFIGMPIDGIQFNDDEIIFMEFKTGEAKLSDKQELIKKLVQGGNVKWMEIRVPPRN